MYVPRRRSVGIVLAVVGLLGPLGTKGYSQVNFGAAVNPGAFTFGAALGPAFNPYVNPLAGQAFGFANGVGFATPWASLTGYGLGLNTRGMGRLSPHGRLGYGGLGSGGYGLYGGLANNLLSGAGFGYGYGYGMSMGNTQWMMNPYQGYLRGAADLTRGQADYWKGIQQARLSRQEVIRSSIETRRAMIEEAEWERAHMPDPEKIRQQALERDLNRARNSPPLNDVWSGRALNSLLRHLIAQQTEGVKGVRVPLSKDVADHINVKSADSTGNVALIKGGADNLDWPEALTTGTFKEGRERINSLLQTAYRSVSSNNNPDNATLSDLQDQYKKMLKSLENSAIDLKPGDYIEAKHFLKEIGNTIKGLQDEKVAHQFNDDWKVKPGDIAGLVKHMREKGLVFAPATGKDQSYYWALYNALAAFDAGMRRVASNNDNADNK